VTRKAGKKSKAAALRAEIAARLETLAALTDQARIGEEMQAYLQFIGRFHRYSFHNVMLILSQRPDATLVAGYRKWQDMGFQVRRGEKGIGILAPMPYRKEVKGTEGHPVLDPVTGKPKTEQGLWFKAVHVFDVGQVGIPCTICGVLSATDATHCEECGVELDAALPHPPQWTTDGDRGEGLAARLMAHARSLDVEVVEEDMPGERRGTSSGGRIALREGLSPLARAHILAHEIAHEVLHGAHDRLELPRAVREAEAEGVAYAVCAHFDLETNAPNYITLWSGTGKLIQERMERIASSAHGIIEAVEAMEESAYVLEVPAGTGVEVMA
jgi:hypothetical protein